MKVMLNMLDGTKQPVEGRKFCHYIGGVQYWFAYHAPIGQSFGLQITHIESGLKVQTVSAINRQSHLGDDKAAAKATLDQLIEKVGADKVRKVIDAGKVKVHS